MVSIEELEELFGQMPPLPLYFEPGDEKFVSYDALMSEYYQHEAIMDKEEFASDAGYDMVKAHEQYVITGDIEGLFTDDKDAQFYHMLKAAIAAAVNGLPVRQQYIINHRYGLDGWEIKTRKVIAQELGITESRVCSQEKSALAKLKKLEYLKDLRTK